MVALKVARTVDKMAGKTAFELVDSKDAERVDLWDGLRVDLLVRTNESLRARQLVDKRASAMAAVMVAMRVEQRVAELAAEKVDLWEDQWADLWDEQLVALTVVLMVGKKAY